MNEQIYKDEELIGSYDFAEMLCLAGLLSNKPKSFEEINMMYEDMI